MIGYLVILQKDGEGEYLLGPYSTFEIAETCGQETIEKKGLSPMDEWIVRIEDIEVEG